MNLSERLSDDQLSQLFTIFSAGHPQPNRFQDSADIRLPENSSFSELISSLNQLDDESISRVLNMAEKLSHSTIKQPDISTYTKNGKLMGGSQGDLSNDLFNFIKLVSKTDDLASTLDKLNSYSPKQQSKLLSMTEYDLNIGEALLSTLSGKDEDTINSTLSYFTDRIKETPRSNSQMANLQISGKLIDKARTTGRTTLQDMIQAKSEVKEQHELNLVQLSNLVHLI
jgi:hypothetical protein